MPQDRSSGAVANDWGRKTAREIAAKIGAQMKGSQSNEASFQGTTVAIKCAATRTKSVGVSFKMLGRLDAVIGAFQQEDGTFLLWSLTPEHFRAEMRDTSSRGPSAGRVGLVARSVFEQSGSALGRVRL